MDVEQRARELLAAACPRLKDEYFDNSPHMTAINLHEALIAVRSTLTPPEGWVLMPRVLTEEMLQAGYPADTAQVGYDAMVAARPEVP